MNNFFLDIWTHYLERSANNEYNQKTQKSNFFILQIILLGTYTKKEEKSLFIKPEKKDLLVDARKLRKNLPPPPKKKKKSLVEL